MQVQRIIPSGMAPETAKAEAKPETARVENTALNQCPICQKPLRFCLSNNVPSMVCENHAVVMPTKD